MQLAVREFKNRLPELLKRAEVGEEIVVTRHGRPVVRLGPVAALTTADPAASLRRLRTQPWLRPTVGHPIRAAEQPVPPMLEGEPLLSDLMLADRE
jgi:prevent-host-death family protein